MRSRGTAAPDAGSEASDAADDAGTVEVSRQDAA